MEEWKPVIGFESKYEISNKGRIRSVDNAVTYSNGRRHLHKGRMLTPLKKMGYNYIGLSNNSKAEHYPVHRLVAAAFIQNPSNKPFINHKNGIKDDNRVENLEWATRSENAYHSYRILGQKSRKGHTLSEETKNKIREKLLNYNNKKEENKKLYAKKEAVAFGNFLKENFFKWKEGEWVSCILGRYDTTEEVHNLYLDRIPH